jgi:hypothetical protein
MSAFKELNEITDMQCNIKNMSDIILDNYKMNPRKCNKLLKELCEINKELDDLEKEYDELLKQL